MKDHENRRDDTVSGHQRRVKRQSDVEETHPFASLEAASLARIGLRQQSAAAPDDPTMRIPPWQKRIIAVRILAKEGGQAQVEHISSHYLTDPDERVRMEAIRGLEKIAKVKPGLVSPERFVGALGDDHPQVRATAVQVLTSLGASWLTDDLVTFLIKKLAVMDRQKYERGRENKPEREDGLVRIAIMQLLVKLNEIRAVPALVAQLDDKDWQVRETAILSLGSFIKALSPLQRDKLGDMLYHENYFVREAAIMALKGQWPVENLLRTLRSHSSDMQAQAARILGELGQPTNAIVDALHEVATERRAKISARVAALLSLKELRIGIQKTVLDTLLQDKNEEVRNAAQMLADPLASELIDQESETRRTINYDLGSSDERAH